MNKLNQAAHLIMEAARESEIPTETAVNAVEALVQAGLLTPELPKPDHHMHDPQWQKEYEKSWGYLDAPSIWDVDAQFSIEVFPGDDTITIWNDSEPMGLLTIDEAKRFRLALHAAEQAAEQVSATQRTEAKA